MITKMLASGMDSKPKTAKRPGRIFWGAAFADWRKILYKPSFLSQIEDAFTSARRHSGKPLQGGRRSSPALRLFLLAGKCALLAARKKEIWESSCVWMKKSKNSVIRTRLFSNSSTCSKPTGLIWP
jgi:hypothetical protein